MFPINKMNKRGASVVLVISKPEKEPLDSPPRDAMVYTHVVVFDELRKMNAHPRVAQHVLAISVSSSPR